MKNGTTRTIGLDVGDERSHFFTMDERTGEVVRGTCRTTEESLRKALGRFATSEEHVRVILEVGAHSPWMSRLLTSMGLEAVVGNARRLRFISGSRNKSDRLDAEMLARVGRMDLKLVHPIQHRSESDQKQTAVLRARDGLVAARTKMINSARGLLKSFGHRVPKSSTPAFPAQVRGMNLPGDVGSIVAPLLKAIQSLTEEIRRYDKMVDQICSLPEYAEGVKRMTQVTGVGNLTALAVHLVLQNPNRFRRSRDVGPYLGLTPGRDQSGGVDKRLGITKQGDPFARRLLVQSAHYVLGPFGGGSDLRVFGQRLIDRGVPKKKVVTAVARKLVIVLHHLWNTGKTYEPQFQAPKARNSSQAAPAA